MPRPHKLVIIGLGRVGDAVLTNAISLGLFGQIALIDVNDRLMEGQALDQHHATAFPLVANTNVYAGTYDDCADADIIVFTAGPSVRYDPDKPATKDDRHQLAVINSNIMRSTMREIAKRTKEAVIIICSNPLDLLVYEAATSTDYPIERIIGTGTILDSARLCRLLADYARVDPHYVRAYMLGEHGASGFPMLSGVNVAGVGYDDLPKVFGFEPLDRDELTRQVNEAGWEVFNSKGWTSAGIGQSALAIAQAILVDAHTVVPVCTLLDGEYGYKRDVALSLPCIIGANGIERRLEIPLDDWEAERLHNSALAIKELIGVVEKQA